MVPNISTSVNKKTLFHRVAAVSLTERVHSDRLSYLAVEGREC
jgi:hypothetical protein